MRVVTQWSTALLCGMALALPAAAQEEPVPKETPPPTETKPEAAEPAPAAPAKKGVEDPPLHRWGGITLSFAAWDPSLIGADEEIAATSLNGVATPFSAGSTSRVKEIIEIAYHLPQDKGSIVAHYDAMNHSDDFQFYTPGTFGFAETRAYPDVLGAFDDGLADGVGASVLRKTREFRLEYQRTAFDTTWARGTWGAGYRQVSHARALGINYLAIVPNLPPVMPPIVADTSDPARLAPLADTVSQTSNFNGHGLGASLNVEFRLHPRVSVISGLAIGLIRGTAGSQYVSSSSYYFDSTNPGVPLTKDELFAILSSSSTNDINNVDQARVTHGAKVDASGQMAETFDVFVGLEVRVWRGLKVFAIARDMYYANVGEYVVPEPGPENVRTSLSAGYEGYGLGLSWRY